MDASVGAGGGVVAGACVSICLITLAIESTRAIESARAMESALAIESASAFLADDVHPVDVIVSEMNINKDIINNIFFISIISKLIC